MTSCLLLFNCNPKCSTFVIEFKVKNESGRTVYFTPVGVPKRGGGRVVLRVYRWSYPAFPALDRGEIKLEPGATASVWYDWKEANFSEIAVADASWQWRQVVVMPDADEKECCGYPHRKVYVIPKFETLPRINDRVRNAAIAGRRSYSALIMYLPLLGPLFLAGGIVLVRRAKREQAHGKRAGSVK